MSDRGQICQDIFVPNGGYCFRYTLFQNGRYFSILLFSCKLALVASYLNSIFKGIFPLNEATRDNLQVNKRILKLRPFWNKVYLSIIFSGTRL